MSADEPNTPVAAWEFWSVANMLIATHGDGAEMKAQLSLEEARLSGRLGDLVTWSTVIDKLAIIRAERGQTRGSE